MKIKLSDIFKKHQNEKLYVGDVVDLRLSYQLSAEQAYDAVPCIFYDILIHGTSIKVGSIDMRLTMDERMYYFGHIGYFISLLHRGNNYAYHACRIIFQIAKCEYNMHELIITCSPDNIASYKTLEKLGGTYLGVFDVPVGHELYQRNEKQKCIFKYGL